MNGSNTSVVFKSSNPIGRVRQQKRQRMGLPGHRDQEAPGKGRKSQNYIGGQEARQEGVEPESGRSSK